MSSRRLLFLGMQMAFLCSRASKKGFPTCGQTSKSALLAMLLAFIVILDPSQVFNVVICYCPAMGDFSPQDDDLDGDETAAPIGQKAQPVTAGISCEAAKAVTGN